MIRWTSRTHRLFSPTFILIAVIIIAGLSQGLLLPVANVIASFHFNFGSIVGPNLGGAAMQLGAAPLLFILLGSAYLLFSASGLAFRPQPSKKSANMNRL